MAFFDPYSLWDSSVTPPTNAEILDYLDEIGYFDEADTLTDTRMAADVTAAKQQATTTGNTKLANTLDFILKYGDKALAILVRNGVLKNQNLLLAGYTNVTDTTGRYAADKDTATTTTSNAPDTTNRVFNIDFTDPKVLIIIFLILLILGYFLFLNPSKNAKR